MEKRESEERRKNIRIRRVVMQGTPRETALRVMKEIGVQAKIREVKEIRRNEQFKRECELKMRMEKMEVLGKNRNLKRKREIIEKDFTWKQQRMQ